MAEEEKPINVDGDITPISKKEVEKVAADEWNTASITHLYDQLAILNSRLLIARQLGNEEIAKQIEHGIKNLQDIINSKNTDSGFTL